MSKQSARKVRETIAKAVETAKPWLKFESVRASGSGSRVMFFDPRPRLTLLGYEEKLGSGKRLDHYLTPEGKIEAWQYRPDGGGEGWIREFVRVVPFSQVNLEKVMENIRTRLRRASEDAVAASSTVGTIQAAMNQI